MKVTVTDQVMELGFDRSAPHEAQRRAFEWLLEDSELTAVGKDENTVQIQREWWYAAGELPASDATEEEADVWASRHAALAALLGYRGQSVHVDTRGYLGQRRFESDVESKQAITEADR
jgi:hypothetical protein